MLRSLYRLYLYIVFTLMTLFAAFSLATMLSQLFAFTPLNQTQGAYFPDRTSLTQSIVLAITTLIVAGAVGGLHYWLIRREQQSDPQPGASVIRSLFLNITEGLYTLSLTIVFTASLFMFAPGSGSDLFGPVGYSISAALVVVLLEFERRRIPATSGAASVFERLHFYGVQTLLLVTFMVCAQIVLATSERLMFHGSSFDLCAPTGDISYLPSGCYGLFAWSQWIGTLFVVAVWGWYVALTRVEKSSAIRQVFHIIGFCLGVVVLLEGIERALEYSLRGPFQQPIDPAIYANGFDFPPTLIMGAVVVGAYLLLLRDAATQAPAKPTLLSLILESLVTIFIAVPFGLGLGWLFYHILRAIALGSLAAVPGDWAPVLALLILGIGYIPLAFNLGERSKQTGIHSPRRGFVLALLALGSLTGAVSAVVLFYTVMTATLGVPVESWQNVARISGSGLLVGLTLAGVYVWIALREGVFERQPESGHEPAQPIASLPATPSAQGRGAASSTLEGTLDELLAGHITRDQAVARIHELAKQGVVEGTEKKPAAVHLNALRA